MVKNVVISLMLVVVALGVVVSPRPTVSLADDDPVIDSEAYLPGAEIINKRTENSKTFRNGNGNTLVVAMGAIHYKNDYSDANEQWKNIDTTIVNDRVDKAPFILTIDRANKSIRVVNKKDGSELLLRLEGLSFGQVPSSVKGLAPVVSGSSVVWADIAIDTDLVIIVENDRVSLRRIIKSDKAPNTATFTIAETGKSYLSTRAFNTQGKLIELEVVQAGDKLTESLDLAQIRADEYPIKTDPTWQVGQSTDDAYRRQQDGLFSLVAGFNAAGSVGGGFSRVGSGMRFTNITIPNAATIVTASLTLVSGTTQSGTTVNTRVSAEDIDDAGTFVDNGATFDARWANRTTARVDWDGIGTWTTDTEKNSPEIKTVIQEIVDRGGWASGQDIVIFWEDFEDRSSVGAHRRHRTWDWDSAEAPKLVVTYAVLPTVTTQAASSVEDTTATGNGNITNTGGENADLRGIVWDLASQGPPGDVAPGASGYANDVSEGGSFGTGAFTRSLTGLPTGDTIYARAYAHNSAGYAYGAEVNFLTKPAAPTNVAATDGAETSKVVITWTKSTGATGYKVYEGANLLDTLGDVATYDDTAAAAGTISNSGTASASDGSSGAYVTLSLASEATTNGASRTYKVRALNATGDSDDSSTDTGYRGVGAITYQWERSAADSDASYSTLGGATTDPYNDSTAPEYPAARWYQCVVSATGASNSPQTSTADRGYRALNPPTVTTQAATSIEDTTATGNGNITNTGGENADLRGIVWDLASQGPPGDVAPGASGYANDVSEGGSFGTGAFTRSLTGLPTGDTIYARAYAHNSAGYAYGAEVNFLTKPAAPTNVAATDGAETSKVVITWTKSTGATDYHVWRDAVDLGAAGDVATFDDAGADPGVITPGSASASDRTFEAYVLLSLSGESTANGTSHSYKVVASNGAGNSDDSSTDPGYRGIGAITYQWQRSAADSDASYGNIGGATTDPYNDTGAPANGDGRWYRCFLDATGAAQAESTHDRGARSAKHLVIYIDGVEEDATLLNGGVADNSANWTFFTNNVMPYIQSANITVNGTLAGSWQWEYGTTFTDQSVNNNTGTPSFRTTSSDADVTAELITFAPVSEARAPAFTVNITTTGWITADISQSGNFTTTTNSTYPGSDIISDVTTAGGVPVQLLELIIAGVIVLSLSLLISWIMRTNREGSLIFKILTITAGLGIMIAVSVVDNWILYLFLMISIALAMAATQRTFTGTGNAGNNMIGFLGMSFIGMTTINRILEGRFIQSTDVDILRNVLAFQPFSVFGLFTIPVPNTAFLFNGLPALVKWDYSFFGGNAQIFQYLLYSITAVVSFMLFVLVFGTIYQMFSRGR